jgi:hypothetical protein
MNALAALPVDVFDLRRLADRPYDLQVEAWLEAPAPGDRGGAGVGRLPIDEAGPSLRVARCAGTGADRGHGGWATTPWRLSGARSPIRQRPALDDSAALTLPPRPRSRGSGSCRVVAPDASPIGGSDPGLANPSGLCASK